MLRYQNKFQVGETIRSYDFVNTKDCFIEGEILYTDAKNAEGAIGYIVKASRRVIHSEVGVYFDQDVIFFVPYETWLDNDNFERVIRIEETSNV